MPKRSDDARINIWKDRIERAEKKRKKYFEEVKMYIDFYKGYQWTNVSVKIPEKPTINLIFAHVKTQLPYLYFQNPRWYVRPKGRHKQEFRGNAMIAETLLNYYVEENLRIALKNQIRLAILDAFFSYGTIKCGYISEFEANENYGEFKILGMDGEKPIYELDDNGEIKTDDEKNVLVHEKFTAIRVSPNAMLFDPESSCQFEGGKFIIQEIVKSLQDVKDSKLYKNTSDLQPSASSNIKPGFTRDVNDLDYWDDDVTEVAEDCERVTLYEIYDIEHNKLLVMAKGHDKFLRDENVPDGIEKHPFVFLRFNEVPDEIYPISDIDPLMSPQVEYNVGRGMIMTHAKRFNRKYAYVKSLLGGDDAETAMNDMKNEEDGTFFEVKQLPIDSVVAPMASAPLDAAVYQSFEQAKQDFREVGGSTEWERGLVERRKTAYEASKISGHLGLRKEDRAALVEEFSTQVGTKLLQSMQANLTVEDAYLIIGEKGAEEWRTVSREDIVGEFNISVEIGSSLPKNPESERTELTQFMQVLGQLPEEIVLTKINVAGMIEEYLGLFQTINTDKILNSPEEEQKMQQLLAMRQQGKGKAGE